MREASGPAAAGHGAVDPAVVRPEVFLLQTSRMNQTSKQKSFAYQTRVSLPSFLRNQSRIALTVRVALTLYSAGATRQIDSCADMLDGTHGSDHSHELRHMPQQQQHFHHISPIIHPFPSRANTRDRHALHGFCQEMVFCLFFLKLDKKSSFKNSEICRLLPNASFLPELQSVRNQTRVYSSETSNHLDQ